MRRLSENSVINLKNKSHSVTAEIEVPESGAEGVIVAQGGAFGGWALYAKGGKPRYCHNFIGLQRFTVEGEQAVPPGTHQVRMELDYDGGGLGKGAAVTLYIDGDEVGEGRVAGDGPADLLRRRDHRPRAGHRLAGQRRLHVRGEHVLGHGQLGAARRRRRRRGPRPPDHAGGAPARRNGSR